MDARGRIIDPEGNGTNVAVNTRDLDAIFKRATHFHAMGKAPNAPKVSSDNSGFELDYIHEPGQECDEDKPGDVYVGCERVPYSLLARVHKLSLARRAGKKSSTATQQ